MPTTPTIRPGVFIEEVPVSARPIREVPTSVTAFVGRALQGPVDEPTAVASWTEFENRFGGLLRDYPLTYAVRDFFANGGRQAVVVRVVARTGRRPMRVCAKGGAPLTVDDYIGGEAGKRGLYALEKVDRFNLLCIPPDTPDGNVPAAVYRRAAGYCYRRRAMLIVDPDREWGEGGDGAARRARDGVQALGLTGVEARNAALFFPRIRQPDPERQGTFAPCGAVAGVIARTDARWGVWKAPAGTAAVLLGTAGLQTDLSDADIGMLGPAGINCLRLLPGIGPVVRSARTLRRPADEFMYIPVRRLALFIEESLVQGLRWAVFEPGLRRAPGRGTCRRRCVHGRPLAAGGFSGQPAGRCLLREVRPGDHDPGRERAGDRRPGRRVCAGETGRVHRTQDTGAGRRCQPGIGLRGPAGDGCRRKRRRYRDAHP